MDRDFARSEMALNRGFGDSFGRMGMVTVKVPVANFSSIGRVLIGGGRSKRCGFIWPSSSVSLVVIIRMFINVRIFVFIMVISEDGS